ncbi:MAG: hypothetical protein R6X20_19225 [Phycisphaerae bacterium]
MSSTHRLGCILGLFVAALALAAAAVPAAALEEIWDLEAVDSAGKGVHGALNPATPVTFEGVCLNAPDDMLDTNVMWQVYVQALPTNPAPYDQSGIALWAGTFFPDYPPYTGSLSPGDHVRVTGYVGDHNGKVNCNSRHGMVDQFEVTLLGHVGMPDPQPIPSIANCNYFDTTDSDGDGVMDRATGGERWQGQWCQLTGVSLLDPGAGWANGTAVPITDASGQTLDMFCGDVGNFDTVLPPPGTFNLTAIFDQEDTTGEPYHAGYRMWPLAYDTTHFLLWGDADTDGDVDLLDAGSLLANYTGMGGSGMVWGQGDFNADGDVDLLDAGELLRNYTGMGGGPAGGGVPMPVGAGIPPGTATGTYDPSTGEVVLSADGIKFLYIYAEGLLTGEDPDLSFLNLSADSALDDHDNMIGYLDMENAQTFTDASLGNVAALGLGEGDLTLTYQASLTSGNQVTVPLTIVPEPATLALAALGLTRILLRRRRER